MVFRPYLGCGGDWHRQGRALHHCKDGGGSRTVIKTYDDPLLSARSPVEMDGKFFYLEGGWVRREKTSTDDDVPDAEHHYPTEGGILIEIESDDSVTDHGIIWRSATKADSPPDQDEESEVYDGWGLHNAVVSNMVVDDRDNLHFMAGYGLPYDIENNSPFARTTDPTPDESPTLCGYSGVKTSPQK